MSCALTVSMNRCCVTTKAWNQSQLELFLTTTTEGTSKRYGLLLNDCNVDRFIKTYNYNTEYTLLGFHKPFSFRFRLPGHLFLFFSGLNLDFFTMSSSISFFL